MRGLPLRNRARKVARMKAVKSLSDAVRLAAMQGASVQIDGRTINSAGARMPVTGPQAKRSDATSVPTTPAQPAPPDRAADLLTLQARVAAAQGEHFAAVMGDVLKALSQTREVGAARPLPAAFDIERDGLGRISRVVLVYSTGEGLTN